MTGEQLNKRRQMVYGGGIFFRDNPQPMFWRSFFATTREIHFKINRIRGLLNSLA